MNALERMVNDPQSTLGCMYCIFKHIQAIYKRKNSLTFVRRMENGSGRRGQFSLVILIIALLNGFSVDWETLRLSSGLCVLF